MEKIDAEDCVNIYVCAEMRDKDVQFFLDIPASLSMEGHATTRAGPLNIRRLGKDRHRD
jgi:hypothetical protein